MSTTDNNIRLTPYFESNLPPRNRKASLWRTLFQLSTTIGMIMLILLLYNIVNQAFGLVAIDNKIDPATLAVDGVPVEELDQSTLTTIIEQNV
jgi:hypothetical protein